MLYKTNNLKNILHVKERWMEGRGGVGWKSKEAEIKLERDVLEEYTILLLNY